MRRYAVTLTVAVQPSETIRRWSSKGVLVGSSSWKYPGWKGQVYNRSYPSQKAFERECLAEYSELFPTVSADFALYDFPSHDMMRMIHEQSTDAEIEDVGQTWRVSAWMN